MTKSLSEWEPAVMTLGDGYGTAILLESVLLRVRGTCWVFKKEGWHKLIPRTEKSSC